MQPAGTSRTCCVAAMPPVFAGSVPRSHPAWQLATSGGGGEGRWIYSAQRSDDASMTDARDADVRVAVIVLNYRTPELSVDCARSALAEIDPQQDRVVVVDNASGDGSAEKIRTGLTGLGGEALRVVESPVNGGFAAGNNVGIGSVRARAYLL